MHAFTLSLTPGWRALIAGCSAASVLALAGCATNQGDIGTQMGKIGDVDEIVPGALEVLPAAITDNLSLCQVMDGEGAFTIELEKAVEETFCIWEDENFPHVDEDVEPTSQALSFSSDGEGVRHIEAIEAVDPEELLTQSFGWEEVWNDGSNGQPRVVVYHWPAGTVGNVKISYPEDDFAASWQTMSTVTPAEGKAFLTELGVL